jgi:hypothetical protein
LVEHGKGVEGRPGGLGPILGTIPNEADARPAMPSQDSLLELVVFKLAKSLSCELTFSEESDSHSAARVCKV